MSQLYAVTLITPKPNIQNMNLQHCPNLTNVQSKHSKSNQTLNISDSIQSIHTTRDSVQLGIALARYSSEVATQSQAGYVASVNAKPPSPPLCSRAKIKLRCRRKTPNPESETLQQLVAKGIVRHEESSSPYQKLIDQALGKSVNLAILVNSDEFGRFRTEMSR